MLDEATRAKIIEEETKAKAKAQQLAPLNDAFRQRLTDGAKVFDDGAIKITEGVKNLTAAQRIELFKRVREFSVFPKGDDPHGEHNFGCIEMDGTRFFFYFDYYDPTFRWHSDDATNPEVTKRVMTVMLASEY